MVVVEQIRAELAQRCLQCGGWSFLARGAQSALEPTCFALLALRKRDSGQKLQLLPHRRRRDAAWGPFEGDTESSGLMGLALLTLDTLYVHDAARDRAVRWLVNTRGREAHWLWKWKFRTMDTRVQFDPAKFGWPWQPGTCSWVVPTAFALLALKTTPPSYQRCKVARRIRHGVEMLLDRACPGGGWNAGNGVVYGHPMVPHIDATAIALLALRTEPRNVIITSSLGWLKQQAYLCRALWSLSWAILALNVYNEPVDLLQERLASLIKPDCISDTATLAVAALGLECVTCGNVFAKSL